MKDESNPKQSKVTRRLFHKTAAAAFGAASGFHFFPALSDKKLEKPTVAAIGIGGKGSTDIRGAAEAGFQVRALVDIVDGKTLGDPQGDKKTVSRLKKVLGSQAAYPDAEFYGDYREMLANVGDTIDAVLVSTPDHHHFHASALAMMAGKHVYCQKPLTHGIWEARMLSQLAASTGVKTQMGNQAHANDHMRRCVELLRAGIVGKVKEIHAWTNRPIWPQGFASPPAAMPVPDGIDWQQWIGPAPWVDYSPRIAPFAWRGWWDYGTGALGDMACHIMDMGYWAMDAKSPRSVSAKQSGATEVSPPINSVLTWNFDQTLYSAPNGFAFHWYDGYVDATFDRERWLLVKNGDEYNHPGKDVLGDVNFAKYGSVVIGDQGKLFFHRGKNNWVLESDVSADQFDQVEQTLPRASGQNPYQEWMDAIEGKIGQAGSHFGHSGPMTETILLGVIAQRNAGQELAWNSDTMQIKDRMDLDSLIRRPYREGWGIDVR